MRKGKFMKWKIHLKSGPVEEEEGEHDEREKIRFHNNTISDAGMCRVYGFHLGISPDY